MLTQKKINRRLALVIFALAIATAVRFWPEAFTKSDKPSPHAGATGHDGTATSIVGPGRRVSTPSPASPGTIAGAAFPPAPPIAQGAPVQFVVRAPLSVQAGDSFEATVNVEVPSDIRALAFTVTYNKTVLQLVGSAEGTFTKQGRAPAHFGAEEPSDGNLLVRLDVDNGWTIGGTGSVAILQFQALKAGTSTVTVEGVTFVDNPAGSPSNAFAVSQAAVTVN
jgi:hypothetical protein